MKAIRVCGLSYARSAGHTVLRAIDFEVDEGACVALVGPNGAGKSTLLLVVGGLLHGEGLVEVLGRSVDRASLTELRREVGIVFQDPDDQLFMPVVLEDAALGPLNLGCAAEKATEDARRALEQAGVAHLADRAPHHLSVGERKRVALAGVLAMGPRVLLLDEPSAGLDPRGRHAFVRLLRGLQATRVVATHDLDLVREACERAVVLDDGRIVAVGTVTAVLSDHALLRAHGLAAAGDDDPA